MLKLKLGYFATFSSTGSNCVQAFASQALMDPPQEQPLFNLGNTISGAQNTEKEVLGEPKTRFASAAARSIARPIELLRATNSRFVSTSERQNGSKAGNPVLQHTRADYQLKIVGWNATSAASGLCCVPIALYSKGRARGQETAFNC
jgi:hypothetical protein